MMTTGPYWMMPAGQCFVVIASIFVNPIQLDQKSVTISLQERSKMMSPISGFGVEGATLCRREEHDLRPGKTELS